VARWIDVSMPLRNGLVPWPGDPPFRIARVFDMARGDVCTVSALSMSAHAGTHIDAPLHFLSRGRPTDALPIDATVGPARVVAIRNPSVIGYEELRRQHILAGERLLLKTRNSVMGRKADRFCKDYVAVSPEGAQYLASRRVRAVGIDGPSIGPFYQGMAETHLVLLRAGVWIIEGLDLARAPTGPCELICLPLRLVGADGAPARAILRRRPRNKGERT
jgi:arylformamidase